MVDKKRFPREKTCGDGLTPRAVRQLHDMGLADPLAEFQRFDGLRSIGHGITLELAWPEHPDFPPYGYVVRRSELDEMVANARGEGRRDPLAGHRGDRAPGRGRPGRRARSSATRTPAPTGRSGPAYVIVADGANSRFGRALGTSRNRTYPLGMAIRGYFTSPLHDDPWIESHLDIRDREGNHLPGYGWIFPVGDGTVNVGVGLLSTFTGWKNVNTSHLMDAFCATAPARWGISPETATCAPTGGRLPTGGSVTPRVGSTYLVVGDAAGSVNPFNGEGISLAYETGRLAADAVDLALQTGDHLALETYSQRLDEVYGLYFKVARTFVRAIGNPAVMRELTRVGMRSHTLMEWVLRIMANLMRPEDLGPAEAAYRAVAAIVRLVPEPA